MKINNLLHKPWVRIALTCLGVLLLLVVAWLSILAVGKLTDGKSSLASTPVTSSVIPVSPAPLTSSVPSPAPSLPPGDVMTEEPEPPAGQVGGSDQERKTFYGVLTLSMDPMWHTLLTSDSATYIDSSDLEKRCHSLDEACPQLRIFNVQAPADMVASTYADCDSPPLFQGRESVGNATAQYYEIRPCHGSANPADFHRIWVIPGKVVIVSQGFNGWEVENLQKALDSATVN